jgi:hypothetical protein
MGVRRVDDFSRRMIGWVTQFKVRGKSTTKYFADNKYGGSDEAHEAAKEFLSKGEAARAEVLCLQRRLHPRRNTSSGLVGVARVVRQSGSASWIAYWLDDANSRKYKRFSVAKYGEEEAMRLAIDAKLSNSLEDIARLSDLLQD